MHKDKRLFRSSRSVSIITAILALLVLPFANVQLVSAADLGKSMVRFDRMAVSTPTTGTICAKPSTALVEASVVVTFPTGYTLGAAGTFTTSVTNLAWPTGGTAWLGIGTATNVTGQVVTFPSTDLVVGTLYCFNWINTAAVTVTATPASSLVGSIATQTSVPAPIDSSGYTTASIANDQITVTASVPSTFSFALSANTDALGTLATASVITSPTPRTATVSTNAKNGWMVWAKDTSTGLASTTASFTIPSITPGTNSTLVAGTKGYNTGITSTQVGGAGVITVDPAFVGTGAGQGGGLDTALRPLASSTGTADTAVLTIKNNAAISVITPAASDYTDIITVIGAGLF